MYTQFMPQPFTCWPRQGQSFIAPPPFTEFNARIPSGSPVGFPRAPGPQSMGMNISPITSNEHYQIPNEQTWRGGMSNNGVLTNPHNPHAEIKALQQQLVVAFQQGAMQDSEIDRLKGLVQKQQGEINSITQSFQKREIEFKREQKQNNIERQRVWEQERKKEQVNWVERQRAWKEREQALNKELDKRQSQLESKQYLKREVIQRGVSNLDQNSQRSSDESSFVSSRQADNKTIPRNNRRDYSYSNVHQPQRRNYDHGNGKRRAQHENCSPRNGEQRVQNDLEQPTRQMQHAEQDQNSQRNNQEGYLNPSGRQPFPGNRPHR